MARAVGLDAVVRRVLQLVRGTCPRSGLEPLTGLGLPAVPTVPGTVGTASLGGLARCMGCRTDTALT